MTQSNQNKQKQRYQSTFEAVFTVNTQFASAVVEGDVVRGLSLITKTPPLGHGLAFDDKTMETAADLICGKDLKSFENHNWNPPPSDIIGFFRNIKHVGNQIVGDFEFYDHFKKNHTARYEALSEIIEKTPTVFGISVSSQLYAAWVCGSGREVKAKYDWLDMEWKGKPADCSQKYPSARFVRITSGDFVSDPAANPNGLFSAGEDRKQVNFQAYYDDTFSGGNEPQEFNQTNIKDDMTILTQIHKKFGSKPDQLALAVSFAVSNENCTMEQIDAHLERKALEAKAAKADDLEKQLAAANKKLEESEEDKKKKEEDLEEEEDEEKAKLKKKLAALEKGEHNFSTKTDASLEVAVDPQGAFSVFVNEQDANKRIAFMEKHKDEVYSGFKAFNASRSGFGSIGKNFDAAAAQRAVTSGTISYVLLKLSKEALGGLKALTLDFRDIEVDPFNPPKIPIITTGVDPAATDNEDTKSLTEIAKLPQKTDTDITLSRCRKAFYVPQDLFAQSKIWGLENFVTDQLEDFNLAMSRRIYKVFASADYVFKYGATAENFTDEEALYKILPMLKGRPNASIVLDSSWFVKLLTLQKDRIAGGGFTNYIQNTYWEGGKADMVGYFCVPSFAHVAARPTRIQEAVLSSYLENNILNLGEMGLPVRQYRYVDGNKQVDLYALDTMIGSAKGDTKAGGLIKNVSL